jgi:hypothetical protein
VAVAESSRFEGAAMHERLPAACVPYIPAWGRDGWIYCGDDDADASEREEGFEYHEESDDEEAWL